MLTSRGAARRLHVTPRWVRQLAHMEHLVSRRTASGQLEYPKHAVLKLVDRRAQAEERGATMARAFAVPDGPRQLALFGRARLRLIP